MDALPADEPPTAGADRPAAVTPTHLQRLWQQDRPAFGVWSSVADPAVAELIASGPLDYICIDLQHGHATTADLGTLVQAVHAAGQAPAVRVPWNEPQSIMRALDLGASTIIVPMVETAADADRAASACRYPPRGARSWGPLWGDVRPASIRTPADQDASVTCLVMVETSAGLNNLEEIAAVDGVDGVYIGPNDLALSTGHGRSTYRESQAVDQMLQHIISTCREVGVVAGLHCSDPAMAVDWAARGASMLTTTSDASLLRAGLVAVSDTIASAATGRENE